MRLLLALLAAVPLARAAPREFSSGPGRTHLLELFTSEGCSSCPPAEAWLSAQRANPRLWRDFVPVAWHVDYWDSLGWKDRFASRRNTLRQYAYSEIWRADSVYTPCFVSDGREWRPGSGFAGERGPAGVLSAAYNNGELSVEYAPGRRAEAAPGAAPLPAYEVHAVLLGMGIASSVRAGENRGRNLRHDFLALTPVRSAALENGKAAFALPSTRSHGSGAQALAIWITRRGSPIPLQAAGGPIP